MTSSAIRANSSFPGYDPLLTCVISALAADAMWTLHAPAARTRLERDRRCFLMCVAGALFPLGRAALGDGHGWSVEMVKV